MKKPKLLALTGSGREILAQREVQGLRWMLATYALIIVLITPGVWFLSTGELERTFTFWMMGFSLILIGFGFYLVSKSGWMLVIGFGLVFLSWAVVSVLPLVWYQSVGGDLWPKSYFLKTTFPSIGLLFIALSGLALRPAYPATLTLGLMVTWSWYIARALSDTRVLWTDNFTDGIFGPSVDVNILGWHTISMVVVGVLVTATAARARGAVREAVANETAHTQLSRYFSPNLVSRFRREEADFFRPGGKVQNVAVLFADLRNFTALTESLPPDEVLKLLSAYHDAMSGAIFLHGGTLDKFIGDGIMATFGTPESAPDDAQRAVRAGLEMKARLRSLNLKRSTAGLDPLGQGIGIHYGPALVGNIGTAQRLEYTVLGDTVNVASRLEGLCKETGKTFLIGGEVRRALGPEVICEALGEREVKGRRVPVEVWAIAVES